MNSAQIRSILRSNVDKTFQTGVYASDQLNLVKARQFAIIINSDDSHHGETHWLAAFKRLTSNRVF